jgi:hypothetical protein
MPPGSLSPADYHAMNATHPFDENYEPNCRFKIARWHAASSEGGVEKMIKQ